MAIGSPNPASQDKLRQDRGVRRIANNAWEGVKDIVGDSRILLGGLVITAMVLGADRAHAQDVAPAPVPGAPAPANPGGKKPPEPSGKESAEQEGDPKFPPMISCTVEVQLKNKIIIHLTRTEDGKGTEYDIEGAEKNGKGTLADRLPPDRSPEAHKELCMLVAKVFAQYFGKGDPKKAAEALESGKFPMKVDAKTIDWEIIAKQKSWLGSDKDHERFRIDRMFSAGDKTIVIVINKGGGDFVAQVDCHIPNDVDPANFSHRATLDRILLGASVIILGEEKDTFEARNKQHLGDNDPEFAPKFRVVRHKNPEVSQLAPAIKKE